MSERDELMPCPFCGCTKSPVERGNGIGDVWLECAQCEASTRLRENIEACANDWNRRATLHQAVPDGWKLVPVEPTEEMMTAISRGAGCEGYIEIGYRMMLAATPQPPKDCAQLSTIEPYNKGKKWTHM